VVNGSNVMDLPSAEKHIKRAWIAGVVSGSVTLLFVVFSLAGKDFLPRLELDAWSFLDIAAIFGLSFGVYRKSRVCAVALFAYFVLSKIYFWIAAGSLGSVLVAVLFGYFFFQGIRGSISYHARVAEAGVAVDRRKRTAALRVVSAVAILAAIAVLASLVFLAVVGPDTKVVPGVQMKRAHVAKIRDLGLLEQGEKILFFYSDAIVDIKAGFYFFSDRKIVVYDKSLEEPAVIIQYPRIENIELAESDSFFEDSQILVTLDDGSEVWFPVSNENDGHRRFYRSLVDTWQRSVLPRI